MTIGRKPDTSNTASFATEIALPAGLDQDFAEAAEAIRQENRESAKCRRLRCWKVIPVFGTSTVSIYELHVGFGVDFDWTWEGALAFRPPDSVDLQADISQSTEDPLSGQADDLWSGEIVEVDESTGRLFVSVGRSNAPPCTGSFYVKPFDFYRSLHRIYHEDVYAPLRHELAKRLGACKGGIHPRIASEVGGLDELKLIWQHSWSILWGPPGTGKTRTLGLQIAQCLDQPDERILVVSTTNRATDQAARAVGNAALATHGNLVRQGGILRIGNGAAYDDFVGTELVHLLRGTETEYLQRMALLKSELTRARTSDRRARLRSQIQQLQSLMADSTLKEFLDPEVKVVVATAYKATALLSHPRVWQLILDGKPPFSSVVIDEAGLISRLTVAALSLLAARRVMLAGDSKQLAPISKMSRLLPSNHARWLAESALGHLRTLGECKTGIHFLHTQYRMHPHINNLISSFQYEGRLKTAAEVEERNVPIPLLLSEQPRAIWYVLDEDGGDLASCRAERGPANQSWIRIKTRSVLDRLFVNLDLRNSNGVFLSPFKAQSADIQQYFAERRMDSWTASTVHTRQGTESDIVIFDTVNAGSTAWPYDEWRRLINVGLSRAREFVLLLASRAEMQEPFLNPMILDLAPRVLEKRGDRLTWREVSPEVELAVSFDAEPDHALIGSQLAKRKKMRPILSREQQQLCGLPLDGKPRLVRGVAGSGKTKILAHWLLQTILKTWDNPQARIWVVFANNSLEGLIVEMVRDAWNEDPQRPAVPWDRVVFRHTRKVIEHYLRRIGVSAQEHLDRFDYDAAAKVFLDHFPAEKIVPVCDAMFVDEGQDQGTNTLKLLTALVKPRDSKDPNSRSIHIFYDNAQNIYGRPTPKWSDISLNMRGRSTVMKESFRSTRPIHELALNVYYRLDPEGVRRDADFKEMIDRGLVELGWRGRQDWWRVRFNQLDGPVPSFKCFPQNPTGREDEIHAIGNQLVRWIRDEQVTPSDICILYNGNQIKELIEQIIPPKLKELGVQLLVQVSQKFLKDPSVVKVTTANSFKGYDAEIVVVAGVDKFFSKSEGILVRSLYVAMTRARSFLAIYGVKREGSGPGKIIRVLEDCMDVMADIPEVDDYVSSNDDIENLAARLEPKHRAWLTRLREAVKLELEPILDEDRAIVAEPLFWCRFHDMIFACFDEEPDRPTRLRLHDAGIRILHPGEELLLLQ